MNDPCLDCIQGEHWICTGVDPHDGKRCYCPVPHDGSRRRPTLYVRWVDPGPEREPKDTEC